MAVVMKMVSNPTVRGKKTFSIGISAINQVIVFWKGENCVCDGHKYVLGSYLVLRLKFTLAYQLEH